MTFGAELLSALPELRAMAESRMLTSIEIQFKVGTTPDPDTDGDVPVYATFLTTKARIKSPGNVVRESDAGAHTAAEVSRILSIPVDSPDPWSDARSKRGVTALVIGVHATDDPTLLGARLTLTGPAPGSQTTARRLEVTEVVR